MRNGDGATDDQGYVQRVNHFLTLPAFFRAADEMIGDAIVAAENGGGNQAQQLFGLRAKGSGFVGLMIEGEKSFQAEMAAIEDFFVQAGAKLLKIFEAVRHDSSGNAEAIMKQNCLIRLYAAAGGS